MVFAQALKRVTANSPDPWPLSLFRDHSKKCHSLATVMRSRHRSPMSTLFLLSPKLYIIIIIMICSMQIQHCPKHCHTARPRWASAIFIYFIYTVQIKTQGQGICLKSENKSSYSCNKNTLLNLCIHFFPIFDKNNLQILLLIKRCPDNTFPVNFTNWKGRQAAAESKAGRPTLQWIVFSDHGPMI